MDYLISKTKGVNGSYYRVLSDVTVFDNIEEFDNARSYDDEYKLQEGEWFVLKIFQQKNIVYHYYEKILFQLHTHI